MGWMASWVAVQGAAKIEVLEHLGLAESGGKVHPGTRAAPFCCREFPNNWLVIFSEDFDWASPKRLLDLSRFGFALACQFEDKVEMTSSLTAARDGAELWRVFHDNTQSIFRLDVSAEAPAALAAIKDKAFEEQRADGGEEASTDFVHDVPLELGRTVCGFHAEEVDAPFIALRQASASGKGDEGKPRSLLGKLLTFGRG